VKSPANIFGTINIIVIGVKNRTGPTQNNIAIVTAIALNKSRNKKAPITEQTIKR
jgi:hypothetical protein